MKNLGGKKKVFCIGANKTGTTSLAKIFKDIDISEIDSFKQLEMQVGFGTLGRNLKLFKEEFFGMENVISKIMRFLKSASLKGEESRQVLLLMGPVGAGKSALTEHIKSSLEGEKYFHVEGDPQRGEPLQLVPRSLRKDFEEKLGVNIDGDLSPVARHILLEELDGKYEDFEVVENTFSQRARRGIATVPPMDANSQDVSVLIGTEDISKLDLYPEDDPRVLSLNGAFNVGNPRYLMFGGSYPVQF